MTPETDNAIRTACRRCTEEIQQAMRRKPKPNWNDTVPPIRWDDRNYSVHPENEFRAATPDGPQFYKTMS